jgi:hypothetical protein
MPHRRFTDLNLQAAATVDHALAKVLLGTFEHVIDQRPQLYQSGHARLRLPKHHPATHRRIGHPDRNRAHSAIWQLAVEKLGAPNRAPTNNQQRAIM